MALSAREKYEAVKMTRKEFEVLAARNWRPVQLDPTSIPAGLQGLPDDKVFAVFGSGSLDEVNPKADGNPDHGQVGGIDVYRVAESEDGVNLNKDWYAIHFDPQSPDVLYLVGPKRDAEHWIDSIPSRLAFADVATADAAMADTATATSGPSSA